MIDKPWRVGRKLGRTIYAMEWEAGPDAADVLVGLVETPVLAQHIVIVHNAWLARASTRSAR